MNTEEPLISIANVNKTFRDRFAKLDVLQSISCSIMPGEFFVLVGPSGCGKSTLLRVISNLEKEYSGTVNFHHNLRAEEISFVFQHFALFPWLTVFQNVEIGLFSKNLSDTARESRVREQLKLLKLEKFANVYPRGLSGGMKQRVGIARALATQPRLILMDEPFSELDSFTAEELREDLLHVWHQYKMTIIMVTHLVEEALELADRIAVMTPRPGRIEKIVHNTLPRPRHLRSPDFFALEDTLYQLIKP